MEDKYTMLISLVYVNNLVDLYRFLSTHKLNPVFARDSKGATALHIATLSNSTSLVQFLIRFVTEEYPEQSSSLISEWVNARNNEGSTCLHYAFNRGNVRLVKIFLKLGADVRSVNNMGLGVMHMAAQSNKVEPLAYLHTLNFPFDAKDTKGATPLHWAAFLGCENSAEILLSWGAAPNCVDYQGETPLHLAVMAGDFQVTRSLLLKGAKTQVVDMRGSTPVSIAQENGYMSIVSILKPPGLLSFCGLKAPQREVKNKRNLMIVYILLVLAGISSMLYMFPIEGYYWFYLIVLVKLILMILVIMINPGYVPKDPNIQLYALSKRLDSNHICVLCITERPSRAKHCQICKRCVRKFDHHCPWINNCIGGRNFGLFYCYLWATFTYLLSNIIMGGMYLYSFYLNHQHEHFVMLGLSSVVSFALILPLSLLIKVQTQNLFTNMTTNERYSHEFIQRHSIERLYSNNYLENCVKMCFNIDEEGQRDTGKLSESDFRYSWIVNEYSNSLTENLIDDK